MDSVQYNLRLYRLCLTECLYCLCRGLRFIHLSFPPKWNVIHCGVSSADHWVSPSLPSLSPPTGTPIDVGWCYSLVPAGNKCCGPEPFQVWWKRTEQPNLRCMFHVGGKGISKNHWHAKRVLSMVNLVLHTTFLNKVLYRTKYNPFSINLKNRLACTLLLIRLNNPLYRNHLILEQCIVGCRWRYLKMLAFVTSLRFQSMLVIVQRET